jgi:hypothetical protein
MDAFVHGVLHTKKLSREINPIPVLLPTEQSTPDATFQAARALLQSQGTLSEDNATRIAESVLTQDVYFIARETASRFFRAGRRQRRLSARHIAMMLAPLLLAIDSPTPSSCEAEIAAAKEEEGVDAKLLGLAATLEEDKTTWGYCEFRNVPLSTPRLVRSTRSFRAGYVGAPVYFSRIPPIGDGAIFRSRRPAPGGTVLIDISGSMNLTQEDVEMLIAQSPGVTIAVYASSLGDLSRGAVTVVARGGRVADLRHVLKQYGYGNVVDGPALEWLGRQPPPRLWISDGGVTGVGDRMAAQLVLDAYRICRKYNIRRVQPRCDDEGKLTIEI